MTVNEMLYEAITTESRKRKCRHQAELEALGFEIRKDGGWYIRCNKTNRYIELVYDGDGLQTSHKYIRFGRVWKRNGWVNKPLSCIDLEGLLTKRPVPSYNSGWTNVNRMNDALRNKKLHTRNLENMMSEYQTKIDNLTKEYQKKIEEAKRSYEWSLDYHTRGLASANETIAKLLHKTA